MKFPKKSLGQNFLLDKNIIKKIINLSSLKDRNVIEIGPGKGSLTSEIIKQNPKSLTLIEKDNNLSKNLKIRYLKSEKIKIFNVDVLKFDIEKIYKTNSVIIGNLPYNISSQILVKILKSKIWPPKFKDLVLMFQKELGDKIISNYPSANYGRISILANLRLKFLNKFVVSPNCFFPKPKVNSLVIHFRPITKKEFCIMDINNLEKITNILFSSKRKMINKNIKKILKSSELKKLGKLNLNLRPSELSPDIYYKITEILEQRT